MDLRQGSVDRTIRLLAGCYLTLEGTFALAWWLALLTVPRLRGWFMAPGAPDATLLAFLAPDLLFFVAASLASAYGLLRRRPWGWPLLCLHAGAAAYAALYSLALPILCGGGWLGALLMAPSLLVTPYLVWRLRPETTHAARDPRP